MFHCHVAPSVSVARITAILIPDQLWKFVCHLFSNFPSLEDSRIFSLSLVYWNFIIMKLDVGFFFFSYSLHIWESLSDWRPILFCFMKFSCIVSLLISSLLSSLLSCSGMPNYSNDFHLHWILSSYLSFSIYFSFDSIFWEISSISSSNFPTGSNYF